MRADLDFTLRLAAAEAVVVPETLMQVRDHAARTTRSVADPHERSALVFERLVARESDATIRKLGRARWAGHLAAAGAQRIADGQVMQGLGLLRRALVRGASVGRIAHGLVSAFRSRRG